MLFAFVVFAFCICLLLIGIGLVIGGVCVLCAATLVAMGIVSSSALLALLRGRVSTGIRALHYQAAVWVALPCGVAAAGFSTVLFHPSWRMRYTLLCGAVGGAAAGMLLAYTLDYAVRLACRRLARGDTPEQT